MREADASEFDWDAHTFRAQWLFFKGDYTAVLDHVAAAMAQPGYEKQHRREWVDLQVRSLVHLGRLAEALQHMPARLLLDTPADVSGRTLMAQIHTKSGHYRGSAARMLSDA